MATTPRTGPGSEATIGRSGDAGTHARLTRPIATAAIAPTTCVMGASIAYSKSVVSSGRRNL